MALDASAWVRPWSLATPPAPRPGGEIAPLAPYAETFDDEGRKQYKSIYRRAHSVDVGGGAHPGATARVAATPPAGCRTQYGLRAEQCTYKSTWDAPDFRTLETTYSSNTDPTPLGKHHRRYMKNRNLSMEQREDRWFKCLKQQWRISDPMQDEGSVVTGLSAVTDFSLLPAGWKPLDQGPHEPQVQSGPRRNMQVTTPLSTAAAPEIYASPSETGASPPVSRVAVDAGVATEKAAPCPQPPPRSADGTAPRTVRRPGPRPASAQCARTGMQEIWKEVYPTPRAVPPTAYSSVNTTETRSSCVPRPPGGAGKARARPMGAAAKLRARLRCPPHQRHGTKTPPPWRDQLREPILTSYDV